MKTLQTYLFVAFFLLGLILITGCSQIEGPTAQEETQAYAGKQSLQKSGDDDDTEGTPFTANVDLSGGIGDLSCLDPTPDRLLLNDCELSGPVSGGLVGSAIVFVTGFQKPVTADLSGNGKFRGALTLDVSMGGLSGTFEGRAKGKWTAGISEGKLKARGTGDFEGMKMKATFLEQGPPPGNLVLTVTGIIR